MSTIRLEIVTPERKVYSDDVNMVIVRGEMGELGILPKHAPFVTPLVISPVRIKKDGKEQLIAISGGFLEVNENKVIILAETAELPEEIDVNRAIAAKERAESRLATTGKEDWDFKRAQAALQRALNRIRVSERK
ncbi:F0F1 ATP synthase subunit epsilon [Tepidibacillus infernus]|uniref:ATP synthase epsilon chain n=1 Tax=Tepidibacillus decaturensis TaxID=1413211 RepID=A0A135L6Q2_9BACI|nr:MULTISPECIES: F0F1 ATP synthase subunit epsilon [Tepidibacillus]KXG44650.1 ATP synthase F1 subunit epsilon [Tepidibacillus decaturensis]GBF11818.1 ATP synthase epsilon chain [Tepidibacillus sp. HK-1]